MTLAMDSMDLPEGDQFCSCNGNETEADFPFEMLFLTLGQKIMI